MVDFVGMRATGGPLLDTGIHLKRGLNVLYGLNGAGKTRLLQALITGLSGEWHVSEAYSMLFVQSSHLAHLDASASSVNANEEEAGDDDQVLLPSGYSSLSKKVRRAARSSQLWAFEPDAHDGDWQYHHALPLEIGGEIARLAAQEDDFLRFAGAMAVGETEGVPQWSARLGLAEPLDLAHVMDVVDSLILKKGSTVSTDLLTALPTDGLPFAVPGSVGSGQGFAGKSYEFRPIVADVITNMISIDLGQATANALAIGMEATSVFLGGEEGWIEHEDFVDSATQSLESQLAALNSSDDRDAQSLLDLFLEYSQLRFGPADRLFVSRWLRQAERIANDLLRSFLLDPPTIEARLDYDALSVISNRSFGWTANDGMALESLSRAERNWAGVCIQLALKATYTEHAAAPTHVPSADNLGFDPFVFLILDEPEAALHRTAEAHMAQGLANLASRANFYLVAATHSPHLLDVPSAFVQRVYRRSEAVVQVDRTYGEWKADLLDISVTRTAALTEVNRRDLEALGLEPSDLLRRQRALLLVEGLHDELLIDHFLHDALVAGRAEVLAIRGASQLPLALRGRLLFDFTEANVVPVLDNMKNSTVTSVWEQAQSISIAEGTEAAGLFLRRELPGGRKSENEFLREFLSLALEEGVNSRVRPFTFSKPDILMYLPISAFTRRPTSWEQVRESHNEALASGETKTSDWKRWATGRYGMQFTPEKIVAAAKQMEEMPEDFKLLQLHLQALD